MGGFMGNGKSAASGSERLFLTVLFRLALVVAGLLLVTGTNASAERKVVFDKAGNASSIMNNGPVQANRSVRAKQYRESEVLVRFKPATTETARLEKHRSMNAEVIRSHNRLRLHQVRLKKGLSVEEAVSRYQSDPAVEYAEPNYLVSIQNTPDDPRLSEQWGLDRISAATAWDLTAGSSGAVVAILDTGIDYTHPDLIANLWVNQSELNGQIGVDEDGNGYLDDINGYNAVNNTGDPKDNHYHGTHVAGIIGAVGNNATGVAGVAWNVKLMACKFLDASGSGTIGDAIECLQYVKTMRNRGVNIVATNNSWGSPSYSQALYDAIIDQKEILFVAAAGNENSKNPLYPAAYDLPNIISVAASDSSDQRSTFSNYNKWSVDIAAPGTGILSTFPGSDYYSLSGTSMATPHVSGLAALLSAQDSNRTAPTLKNLILAGGDPLSSFADLTVTGKRINAYKSLTCSNSPQFAVLHLPQAPQAGVPQTLSAMSINCGTALGPVSVTPSGGQSIPLLDDGVAPDLVAGDGIFAGTWIPVGNTVATLTFTSPGGTVSVSSPPVIIGEPPAILAPAMLLPNAVTSANINALFSQTFPIAGGVPPYTWALVKGSLPAGVTLNSATGEIFGTATMAGVFAITLQVSDSLGVKDRKDWTLLLNDGLRSGWPRELQQRIGTGFLPESYSPIMADLDGDGKDEIIVGDVNTLYVFYPDGTSRNIVLPGKVTTPVVADLDGDGRREIIVSVREHYASTNSIYAFHPDLTPVTGFPAGGYSTTNGGPGYVSSPAVADFNNDGQLKIAVVASPNNGNDPNYTKNVVIMVDSRGQMVPGWPRIFGTNNGDDSPPAVGDIDRDGRKELVFATVDGYVRIFRPDGTLSAQWQFNQAAAEVWSPVLADMDGDGILDVVVKYHPAGTENVITVLNRNGALLPGWPKFLSGNGSATPYGPIVADIDGDGLPEILAVTGAGWNELQALRGDGSSLPNWPVYISGQFGEPVYNCYPVVADINGDGQQEVLITTIDYLSNGRLLAYDPNGILLPGFPKYASTTSDIRSTAAIGDVDGNGKLDLVVKSENGFLYAWEMSQDAGVKKPQWPMFRNDAQHSALWVPFVLSLSPKSHHFGSVLTGSTSAAQSFTISNPRFENVTVSGINFTGQDSSMFSSSAGSCGSLPLTLAPMQSCTVAVSFTPTSGGAKDAVLTVSTTDPLMVPAQAALSGTGMLPIYRLGYTRLGSGNGTVTSSTGTNYTTSGSESVPIGAVVVLTATAEAGSVFTGWEGACTGTGECTVTMDGDKQVTATFENAAAGLHQLNILRSGPGNSVVTYTPGGACPSLCSHLYASGAVVTLTPALSPDSLFAGWSGCDAVSGTTCTVTMSGTRTVTAAYKGIQTVTAGFDHSIALKGDGTVWNWGDNGWGQLGDGTKSLRRTPLQVPGLADIVSVTSRTMHSAALKGDGTVWTWGFNGYGGLGSGTTNERLFAGQVPGLTGAVAVATGYHTVVLKGDGTVWAWGYNYSGQVGDGTTANRSMPVQVAGLSGVVAIAAGTSHTVALKGDGTVWTWGDNSVAQLGDGGFANRAIPAKITGISGVVAIAAGDSHTIALKSDGTVWAWGNNYQGQLGDGTTFQRRSPIQIPGLSGSATISAGGAHSLLADNAGTLKSWGDNTYGQLGDGTTNQSLTPVQVPGVANVVAVAGGRNHSLALKGDGTVWAWGFNTYGQLGDASTTSRLVPVQVQYLNLDPTVVVSISLVAGANGIISGPTTVSYGASAAYTITPATGYHVLNVLVDGVSVGAVTSYSFTNVIASHTLSATFAINTFTITATAGANGSVSGPATVDYGGSASYTITPAAGYRVSDVLVDGVSVGALDGYTFTNVTASHTISATFAAAADLIATSVTAPTSATRGKNINLSSAVKNQGLVKAGSFTVTFHLSSDSSITSTDTLLGTKTVTSLNAGSSTNVGGNFAVPSGLAPGRYYVGVIVDSGNGVVESSESNNSKAAVSTTTIN